MKLAEQLKWLMNYFDISILTSPNGTPIIIMNHIDEDSSIPYLDQEYGTLSLAIISAYAKGRIIQEQLNLKPRFE